MDKYNTLWHTGEEHELKTAIDRIVRDLLVGSDQHAGTGEHFGWGVSGRVPAFTRHSS